MGPAVDDGDFKSFENGLTIANTDIKLKKNGGASASKNSGGATADGTFGMYHLTFDATDTATVGDLFVTISVSGALPFWATYTVVEEAVYDALFAASAPGYVVDQPVNTTKFAGQTITAGAGVTIPSSIASPTNITAGVITTVTTLTNAPNDSGGVTTLLSRVGTPSNLGGGATLAGNLSDIEAQTDDIGAAGAGLTALASATNLATVAGYLDTEIAAIKAVTDALPNAGALSSLATAAALATVDDFIDTEIATISVALDAVLALLDDARAEPGQGAPPVNPDAMTKIDYLYKAWRNKKTNDGTTTILYADNGTTVDQKQATSEAAGTVTKAEWVTGP